MKLFNETIENKYISGLSAITTPLKLQCDSCKKEILAEITYANHSTCPYCGYLYRMPARRRIAMTADPGSFTELDKDLKTKDPLRFPEYQQKVTKARQAANLPEAIVTGYCTVKGQKTAIAVMDSYFMMGSMGTTVGEKIVRMTEYATENNLPVVIFCSSGGARMQEGMYSLLQMSRTTIALSKHSEAGLLYVSVLTNPTTGGVTASFAMQGDVILAEPNALIGFAGPRVIQQTVNKTLPEGFQTSEYLYEHGIIDRIVPRPELKDTLYQLLAFHNKDAADIRKEN